MQLPPVQDMSNSTIEHRERTSVSVCTSLDKYTIPKYKNMSIKGAENFRKKNRFLVIKRSANFLGGFIIYFYYFVGITHFPKVI